MIINNLFSLSRNFKKISCVLMVLLSVVGLNILFVNNTNALWGDKIISDGIQARDVNGFIAEIEAKRARGGSDFYGATSIINALGGESYGAWKSNLARVTSVQYVANYLITESTVLNGSTAVHGALQSPQRANVLIFYINSSVYFIIDTACGNFTSMPTSVPPSWDLYAWTDTQNPTVYVGDKIVWNHSIKNSGPDNTSSGISSHAQGSGGAPTEQNVGSGSNIPKDGVVRAWSTAYVPTSVGTVCEQILYTPASNAGGHWHGNNACVTVIAKDVDVLKTNDCRPIMFKVEPKYYAPVSHTAPNGTRYYSANGTMPVNVRINGSPVGNSPYNKAANIETGNFTTNFVTGANTNGDPHTVVFSDVAKHIYRYDDVYVDDYTKPIYNKVPVYKTVTTTDSKGKTTTKEVIDHYDSVFSGYYQQKYGYTEAKETSSTWTTDLKPCYDYKLSITGIVGEVQRVVENDSSISVTPTVVNSAYTSLIDGLKKFFGFYSINKTKSKKATQWIETTFTIEPKNPRVVVSKTKGGDSNLSPCEYFKGSFSASSPVVKCSSKVYSNYQVNNNASNIPKLSFTVGHDVAVGTRYCFAFSVNPSQSDPNNSSESTSGGLYNHSPLDNINCTTVSKKPKTQILGGDLLVGRATSTSAAKDSNVATSISSKTIGTFGSWIEYGILASGSVSGAASGAAFQSPATGSSNTCKYSTLTFSNTNNTSACNGALGKYKNSRIIPDVAARYKTADSIATYTSNGSLTQNGLYRTGGAVNISGLSIGPGRWYVINAGGAEVTISGNINYTGTFTDIKSIPQLVIIAGNIKINDNVTNIDAWLVSSGEINTCSNVTGNLNSNMCNNKLTVNGPVMAKTLNLRRTAGSGTGNDSGTPAEVFNFRADALLWAYNQSALSSGAKVRYVNEVPTRL